MSNSLQVFDTLGYHRARYAELVAGGWTSGHIAPPARGKYERLTPSLSITVDVWDDEYCCWRRFGKRVERVKGSPSNGVMCANQDLPWRRRR